MTPEQFYSESKWPEMKDKFHKTALLFHHYDLCQFAHDYAQQELQAYRDIIKELLPIANQAVTSLIFKPEVDARFNATIQEAKKLIDTDSFEKLLNVINKDNFEKNNVTGEVTRINIREQS